MSLSIIMPCYNEEKIIEKTVRDYYAEIIDKIEDSEFIVIDDCSTDTTADILKRMQFEYPRLKVIRQPANMGHGAALMLGYRNATKSFVFNIDSDYCFKALDFWKLYDIKDKAGLISGFRVKRQDPPIRIIIAKLLKYLILILFGLYFKDINCPFKLIQKNTLEHILEQIPKQAFIPSVLVSILFAYRKYGEILEIPVQHYEPIIKKKPLSGLKLTRFCIFGVGDILTMRFKLTFKDNA